jgi:dihydropteroate synthase
MIVRDLFVLRFADGGSLELGRQTRVMGVLNVTPDSFSDGGRHRRLDDALRAAEEMQRGGAEIVDVGGESTRPGAAPVAAQEEARRVVPVIAAIKARLDVRVSVDTMKAEVASRAIDAGADLINDVSAFRDPEMLPVLASHGVPAVAMHMRGTPATMQSDTRYGDLLGEVVESLAAAASRAAVAGLTDDKIMVDPGIGFGKSVAGNLAILEQLARLKRVGRPILVGASRKRFIGEVLGLPVEQRLEGSLAVATFASAQGAHVIRAHDVNATSRAVRMIDAIRAHRGASD